MKAEYHLLVVVVGCIGLFLGNFLIDLDHSGSLGGKWKCFASNDCGEAGVRGFFHRPLVAMCIISFLLCFVIGYIMHLAMDVRWTI